MDLHFGADDLPDTFWGCPVHACDQRAAVMAVWSLQVHGWRFGVLCPKNLNPFPMQGSLQDEKAVYIIPGEASRQQVIVDLSRAVGAGIMTEAQATKTRGRSNWVGTNSFGRLGLRGLAVHKHLQYHGAGSLSNLQRNALRFSSKSHSQHAAAENQSGPCPRNSICHPFRC